MKSTIPITTCSKPHNPFHNETMATTKKSKKMKFKKAPGAPKRFKSAYMFFSEHQHKIYRQQTTDRKVRSTILTM